MNYDKSGSSLVPGRDVRLNKQLKEELDMLLYQVKNEGMDLLIVIDGKEGIGKSQSERNIGAYCAHVLGTPFGVDNVHYSTEEYMRSSQKLGRFSVHCLDEAGVLLHRSEANTKNARRFFRYLQVAREGNNQVHIITLPAFHLLDGYIVNWRCKFVMNMYGETVEDPSVPTGKRLRRGAFNLYPAGHQLTEKWNLYRALKIFVYPSQFFIRGRMPNSEPFSQEESIALYKKKDDWRNEFINGTDKEKEEKINAKSMEISMKRIIAVSEHFGAKVDSKFIEMVAQCSKAHSYLLLEEYRKRTKGVSND